MNGGGGGGPLREALAASRSRILAAWLARTLDTYPEHTSHFLAHERDPFRNPVGHALQQTLPALFDELVGEMSPARLTELLDRILRIRAVQDFTPSQAVGFLLLLKTALRESLADECRPGQDVLTVLDSRIDLLMLLAFDVFVGHRERIYTLKVNEAKRRFTPRDRIPAVEQP